MVGTAIGVLSVLDIILDMDDKNTKRNQEIESRNQELKLKEEQAKVDRNIRYINTAVDVFSKGLDIYAKYQAQQQSAQVASNNFVGSSPVSPPLPPASNYLTQPVIEIDYSSVYFDKKDKVMAAKVIDKNSGQSHLYAYHIQDISNSQRNILESVDHSKWISVGVLDLKTAAEDIGTPRAGGYIFGEIFKAVLKQESQKKLPPVPQIPQVQQNTRAPQIKKSSQISQAESPMSNYNEAAQVEEYQKLLSQFIESVRSVYGNIPNVYFIGGGQRAYDKIVSAIQAYAPIGEYGEYPIASFDDTLFGGADDGFLISDEALYFHNAFESNNYRFSREQIYSITNDYSNNDIYINESYRLHLALLNENPQNFNLVINMIKDCLRLEL